MTVKRGGLEAPDEVMPLSTKRSPLPMMILLLTQHKITTRTHLRAMILDHLQTIFQTPSINLT